MRIVYVHTEPLPGPMAGSGFAVNTAVGLAEAGVETTLVMPSAGKSAAEALAYYDLAPPPKLRIAFAKPQEVRLGPLRLSSSSRFYRDALRVLNKEARGADAIVVRTLKLAHFLTRQPLPAPLLYEMHDWYGDVREKWRGAEWMISRQKLRHELALEAVEKETMPRVAGLIVLRRTTADLVRRAYPDKPIFVAPTGLRVAPTLPDVSREPIIVYQGQLHPHKGLDLLFKALALAPDIRLLVVGGGEWLTHWRREAARQGVAARVEFVGHVPGGEVARRMAKARVGVLPLRDCFFNRYVTSPLKIMEYFAAGLPVVTADAPVTRELVEPEKTGLLTPFDDPPALAAALRRLCLDDVLHAACRVEIARRLPGYSWMKRGEKIAGFAGTQR